MRTVSVTVLAVMFSAAGCSSGKSSSSTPTVVPPSRTPAAASTATKPAGIGTALDLAIPAHNAVPATAIRVTLVKVVDPSTPGSSYDTVPAGKRQIALQFQIVDTGSGAYAADPVSRVKVRDAAGEVFEADLMPDTTAGPGIDTGLNLAPGGAALGFVTVKLPAGVKVTLVEYTATPFGGDAARWMMG